MAPERQVPGVLRAELQTGYDILILPVDGDETSGWKIGKPTVFLNGPASEQEPMFSPDGRWLAYLSNESGRQEVYVKPFPGPEGLQQISNDGGTYPAWSRTTSELFYNDFTTQQMMVASYTSAGDSLRVDKPRVWSPGRLIPGRDCARSRCTLTASASQLPQLSRIPERRSSRTKWSSSSTSSTSSVVSRPK